MIYTSRFQNPELATGNYTVVGMVRGLPRFTLKYERAGNIIELAPPKEIFDIYDRAEFTPPYMAHLDNLGLEHIEALLKKYTDMGKDVVLCCYEDVRITGEWCHRLVFSEWWQKKTGQIISELKDDSPIKGAKTMAKTKDHPKEKIWSRYSLWTENGKWFNNEIFYRIDSSTGKKDQIANAMARELIKQGKAEWVKDEYSKVEIKFVFSSESVCNAYWLASDGSERDINLEYALRLIMENKARIQRIDSSKE